MTKFKNLVLVTALIIGGVSANAVASTFVASVESEAATFQNATFLVGDASAAGEDIAMEQGAIPFTPPAALPEPASSNMMRLGFASLGLVGFTGKRRSRRDLIPSFLEFRCDGRWT